MKLEVTHATIFFFVKHKDLAGGTTAAKTSPPPCDRSGAAGTRAPEELGARALEELVPDDRLLQKDQNQSQNKRRDSTAGK